MLIILKHSHTSLRKMATKAVKFQVIGGDRWEARASRLEYDGKPGASASLGPYGEPLGHHYWF